MSVDSQPSSQSSVELLEYKEDSEATKLKPVAPKKRHAYGDAEYWEQRYQNDVVPFEWYQKYESLKDLIKKYIQVNAEILMLGCGNSTLSEDMVEDGYHGITNMDISSTVIRAMKMQHLDLPQLKYVCADARSMSLFPSGSFDAVIDKGTFDALMCGDDAFDNVRKMMSEVSRVLRPGGVYFMVSYGEPKTRMPSLSTSGQDWTVHVHLLPRPTLPQGNHSWPSPLHPVPVAEDGSLPVQLQTNEGDFHYVYACVEDDHRSSSKDMGRNGF